MMAIDAIVGMKDGIRMARKVGDWRDGGGGGRKASGASGCGLAGKEIYA
jgi:hypothetical protein